MEKRFTIQNSIRNNNVADALTMKLPTTKHSEGHHSNKQRYQSTYWKAIFMQNMFTHALSFVQNH